MTSSRAAVPAVGVPVALIYKFGDQGPFVAALIPYYGTCRSRCYCWQLRPWVFFWTAIPGCGNGSSTPRSASPPVIGEQLGERQSLQGNPAAIIVGGVIAICGDIGVAQAFQNAPNVVGLIGISDSLSTLVLTHQSRSVKWWKIMRYASGMGRNDFWVS